MPPTRSKKPAGKATASPAPRRSRTAKPAAREARSPAAPTSAGKKRTSSAASVASPRPALDFLPARPSDAPRNGPRHAVFIDVENTSSEIDLVRVLEGLKIDRATTDLTAVGNWRVVGQQLGRMLAQRGAHLVHSAPAPRVPDWSDLWIAVTAGMWLGRAAPGDALDILSDDRAFDAVGDAAARLGVTFRRITYRSASGLAERATSASEDGPASATGRRRRRRRRGESGPVHPRSHATVPRAAHVPTAPRAAHVPRASSASVDEERHSASLDQIRAVIARLIAADPPRGVSLDTLTLALKAEGFQRPPGSPRLVTRLRRIKGVEVLSNNRVRLAGPIADVVSAAVEGGDDAPTAAVSPSMDDDADASATTDASEASDKPGAKTPRGGKRRGRRGGRRRGGRHHAAGAASPEGSA